MIRKSRNQNEIPTPKNRGGEGSNRLSIQSCLCRTLSENSATNSSKPFLTESFLISGIFVMTVGMKYMTARTSITVGALLQTIFYVVTAFAENFGVLYFTYGFVPGASHHIFASYR